MSVYGGRMFSRKVLTLFGSQKRNLFGRLAGQPPVAAARCLMQPKTTPFRSYYCLSGYQNNVHGFDTSRKTSCTCGGICSSRFHTQGDKEFSEFLTEEIAAETKSQKSPKLPKIEGFEIVTNGADVTLTSKFKDEKIKVKLNVNLTVDTDAFNDPQLNENEETAELPEIKSKPNFLVEIERGGKILSFGCTVAQDYWDASASPDGEPNDDVFNIAEVTLYEGDRDDTVYTVSGEVLDGYLYDLMMNFLEDRGISNPFAERLVEFCTSYEHKLYIGLLENLKSFLAQK